MMAFPLLVDEQIGEGLDEDPRLKVLKKEWFEGKDCLDIGCNSGLMTIHIGKFHIFSFLIHKEKLSSCLRFVSDFPMAYRLVKKTILTLLDSLRTTRQTFYLITTPEIEGSTSCKYHRPILVTFSLLQFWMEKEILLMFEDILQS